MTTATLEEPAQSAPTQSAPAPGAAIMRAIVQDGYGSAGVLALRDIHRPAVGDSDVLIRVRAAGVNIADWAIVNGLPYIARPAYGMRTPKIPVRGTDVAGEVEAAGTGVTRFRPGDEVFGWCTGSFAEYVAAPEAGLALKPANLTFAEAAAIPMAGSAALQALRDHGKVQAGQRVLINGASGGIGSFAIQIAKSLGAEVTGVCSTANVDLVRSIGADHVIDYTRDDFTDKLERYDFILDNVGNHSLSRLRRALSPTGTLVANGGGFENRWFASGGRVLRTLVLSRFGSQVQGPFLVAQRHEDLTFLKELIEAGVLTPVVSRSYALSDAALAVTQVGAGHTRGKLTLTV